MKISVMMPVLIRHPWQIPMSVCALQTLRCTTSTPFELVVVETESKTKEIEKLCDKYIHIPVRENPNRDCNEGLNACTGNILIYTGNDIFVRPNWLEAISFCFIVCSKTAS